MWVCSPCDWATEFLQTWPLGFAILVSTGMMLYGCICMTGIYWYDVFSLQLLKSVMSHEVTFLLLMAYFRSTAHILVEQPLSSWLFKQKCFLEIIHRYQLQKILTYQGCWGGWLMKGTHLMTTLPTLSALGRRATRDVRARFKKRVAEKHAERARKGLPPKVFYERLPNGKFHGTKQLAETAQYPWAFVRDIYKCWKRNHGRSGLQWALTLVNCHLGSQDRRDIV